MKRIKWSKLFFVAGLLLVIAALVISRMDLAPRASESTEPPAMPEGTYAIIGDEPVPLELVERDYARRSTTQENYTLEEYFNETYAPRTMLLLEAQRLNLTVSDEEIDAWIVVINRSLQSQNATFDAYLDDLNLTLQELRRDIRQSEQLDKVLEFLVAREVMVLAEEVQEAYEAAGYEERGITLEQARNEIGAAILREKHDERLRAVIIELQERYDITLI